MAGAETKKSDLPARTVSAVVMVAVAGGALWLGGPWWTTFVALVAAGVYHEWAGLVGRFAPGHTRRHYLWQAAGIGYVALAAIKLVELRGESLGLAPILAVILAVVATDVGAYFAGRAIGGPKIAPAISPSKTWAGLFGGMVGATVGILAVTQWQPLPLIPSWGPFVAGPLVAIVAQAGDFFESWMKRRAGVKDSGKLIPGHGGLFDRVDGLLAVMFVYGLVSLASAMVA